MDLSKYIANVPGFPKEGIIFRDLTPILENHEAFSYSVNTITDIIKEKFPEATHILAPEARGFWFGSCVAFNGGYSFIPVRKPGKLPRKTVNIKYDLEYGQDELCITEGVLNKGDKVVMIDDLIATGGTLVGIKKLCDVCGAEVLGTVAIVELVDLGGREKLDLPLYSLLQFQETL